MAVAPSRATGLPVNLQGLAASIPLTTTETKATGPQATTTTSSGTEKASQAVSSSSSSVNAPASALSALDSLISQLSDRPAISDQELDAKFPLATRKFSPGLGWYWTAPGSEMSISQADAERFNAQQAVKKADAQRAAGTIKAGTDEQKAQGAERQKEVDRNREQQGRVQGEAAGYKEQAKGYSKEAANFDANALIQKSIADALQAAAPKIAAGLEGAGTSRSTIAASLAQDAALEGATEGAALGANLGVQYGGIGAQYADIATRFDGIEASLANTLEALTRSDPNSPTAMLLNAIVNSKGMVSTGSQAQTTATTGQKTGTENKQQSGQTATGTATRAPTAATPATVNAAAPIYGMAGLQLSGLDPSMRINVSGGGPGDISPTGYNANQQFQSLVTPSANSLFTVIEE